MTANTLKWNGHKCDLHRHMGACVAPRTVVKILNHAGIKLSIEEATQALVCHGHNIGFKNFLNKFTLLDKVPWADWAIDLAIKQICDDLVAEKIHYTEISLSINKYVATNGWSHKDVLRFISDKFKQYSDGRDLHIGLLLSLRYDSDRGAQLEHAKVIDDPEISNLLCGIDLIGDEDYFDVDFYKPIFDRWRPYNKLLRAHVGEMPGKGKNVELAINELHVDRIAHGIHASDDAFKLAADKGVCFDLALHSNLTTGAWPVLATHPIIKMLKYGCTITLNTDDPVQFACTLNDEFVLAINNGLINYDQAMEIMLNAWRVSSGNLK